MHHELAGGERHAADGERILRLPLLGAHPFEPAPHGGDGGVDVREQLGPGHLALAEFGVAVAHVARATERSEEHTSELQSRLHLVCRLLLVTKDGIPGTTLHWVASPSAVQTFEAV